MIKSNIGIYFKGYLLKIYPILPIKLLIVIAILALNGCRNYPVSYVEFTPLSTTKYQPTNSDSVEIFVAKLPTRDFYEIGFVYVPAYALRDQKKFYNSVDKLKEIAAKNGADAVIRITPIIQGVAIKWK